MNEGALELIDADAPAVDHLNVQVIPLPASGRTLALAQNPDRNEGSEPGLDVLVAIDALRRLDKVTVDARQDETLSEIGRKKRLESERPRAVQVVGRCWQNVEVEQGEVAKRVAELYAIPPIDPTHAAAASIDREIREYARSLIGKDRSKFIRSLGDPEHQRVALALCRSPVSCGIFEPVAKDAWRRAVELDHPAEVAQLQAEQASVQWARVVLARCATLVAETAGLDRKQIIGALLGEKELSAGAHRAFGIADADWQAAARAAGGQK